MKKIFVLSTFICFATICACQKQDSAAEAQLAQRKAELDTREKALDEREKALVEREKNIVSSRIIQSRQQARSPAEIEAERERTIQELPPELQALIRDHRTEQGTATADRAERLRRLEEERRKKMSAIASPNAESSDTQPSSPSPSPTPQ